jgi:DNA modification methylase
MKMIFEINKIYLEDCVSFMKKVDDEFVDLIIADPPYNLNKDFGNNSDIWDTPQSWLDWSTKWIDECIRILKPTGSIFIYGIHHFMCYIQCYLYEKEMKYRRQIIWHYENGFSTYKNAPAATYEPILWFSKTDNFTYLPIRIAYKSQERLKHKITKNGKIWTPNPEGKHAGDVWNIPTLAGKRFQGEKEDHPTQKPLALCDRLVGHFSNPGDLIYMPFAGSGSECISCLKYNRKFLATEINAQYLEISNKRLNAVLPTLF